MSFKELYWKYSLIIIILALGIVLFMEFRPFLGGILGAFTIYMLLRKQMLFLIDKKKMRKNLVALLLLGEAFLFFLIPSFLIIWWFVDKLQNLNLDPGVLVSSAEHIADVIRIKTGYNLLEKENIDTALSFLPKIGQVLVGSLSDFVVNVATLLVVLYFMLTGGKVMEDYMYDILPFDDKEKRNVLNEISVIVRSNAIGIPMLGIIQGAIAFVAYLIFNVPSPLFFSLLTCFATIFPILGTALVWFPLVVYLGLTGSWASAIGLMAFSLIIITNVDNLIRFVLQKKLADTHPLITIFGVIIGLSLFGFMGVIFGPLLLSVFILCVDLFKKEYLGNGASPVEISIAEEELPETISKKEENKENKENQFSDKTKNPCK